MSKIVDKVIVVTGAADGIGFSIAKKFLENGAKCAILLDIDEEKGTKAAEKLNEEFGEFKATFLKCDVTRNLNLADEIIDKNKTIDVLVNSAGIGYDPDHKKIIDINVTATIEWTYKFHDNMRIDKNGNGGTIINLSSIFGYMVTPHVSTYHASKFAVLGFTRSLGHIKNFEKTGVRVVGLCPGFTHTKMTEGIYLELQNDKPDEFIQSLKKMKWQAPDVVGDAALEVFENAESGSAWVIENGGPTKKIYYDDKLIL